MKKRLILIITAVMLCVMPLMTFAANPITISGGSDTCTVKGKYNAAVKTDVYKVDITWGGMEFDYNAAGEIWDAAVYQWKTTEGSWTVKSGSSNTIVFANHSSAAVDVTLALTNTAVGIDGVFKNNDGNAVITNNTFNMAAANNVDGASTYTANFMPSGTLADTFSNYDTIGTITVTVN